MKIFLAWSGDASKAMAQLLHRWLPDVIQSLQPFMSEEDIRSGERWLSEIGKQLAETNFAILCATPDSLGSGWMHFEAGAVAKDVDTGQVCALLVDLQLSDLVLPLSQFQNRIATDHVDVLRLVRDLNKGLPEEQRLDQERLDRSFERSWPEFQKGIEAVRAVTRTRQPQRRRPLEEILEALLAVQQGSVARLDAIEAQVAQLRLALATQASNSALSSGFTVGNIHLPAHLRNAQGDFGRVTLVPQYITAGEGSMPRTLSDPPAAAAAAPPKKA